MTKKELRMKSKDELVNLVYDANQMIVSYQMEFFHNIPVKVLQEIMDNAKTAEQKDTFWGAIRFTNLFFPEVINWLNTEAEYNKAAKAFGKYNYVDWFRSIYFKF